MSRRKKRMVWIICIIVIIVIGFTLFKLLYEKKLIRVAHDYLSEHYSQEMQFKRVTYNWFVDPAQHYVFFSAVDNQDYIVYVRVNHNLSVSRGNPVTEFKGNLR